MTVLNLSSLQKYNFCIQKIFVKLFTKLKRNLCPKKLKCSQLVKPLEYNV